MEFSALITLFFASLVLMIKPGPYMMTFISMSLEGKWRSMLTFWSGYVIMRTLGYYALLGSLSMLPQGMAYILIFIKATAAIVFVVLGVNGLQDSIGAYKQAAQKQKEELTGKTTFSLFSAGCLLCLSNPYDLIFILAVVPALLQTTEFSFLDITYVHLTVTLADILVQLSYILPLLYVRNFMSQPLLRKIKIGSSVALILIGAYIFVNLLLQWDLAQTDLISKVPS
tara:strand:- start:1054 stop:1734 length:681 start_codon:yes stop_codon:yes gene_type:complete